MPVALIAVLKFALLIAGTLFVAYEESNANAGSGRAKSAAVAERKAKSPVYHRRSTCRICDSPRITEFLNFGEMPLANAFRALPDLDKPEPRFPLSAVHCENCGLVQVPDVVNPSVLFSHYTYFSSASQPMIEHFRIQAELIRAQYLPHSSDLICEIGSNDGIFLQNFIGRCRVIGVDPADNIATVAALKGVTTVNKFFNPHTAGIVRELFGAPKIVFAANCFAHIDDIHGIMEGIRLLLAEDGVFIFENHRFADMLRSKCFDQVYHEHLCYYTLKPIEHLMDRYGMRVIDVRTIPTHGESFQVHAAFKNGPHLVQPTVAAIREQELAMGLSESHTYEAFSREVQQLRTDLVAMLRQLKASGKRIVGYGAPGKGTTLLNYCGVGHETLDYIIDSTPIKQGLHMPGTRIPILPPERLQGDSPDYLLLLSWNYADAILKREQSLRERGIQFIIPVPRLRIV